MSDFDLGDRWRELSVREYEQVVREGDDEKDTLVLQSKHGFRYWIPVEPVPALPTVPYTVIRVDWDEAPFPPEDVLMLEQDGRWGRSSWAPSILRKEITGFEVLSEPRAVTARAVLDRVRATLPTNSVALLPVGREFGVSS